MKEMIPSIIPGHDFWYIPHIMPTYDILRMYTFFHVYVCTVN